MVPPLTNELRLIAEQELNEVPSRIEEDINTIRNWLERQPHLKARLDDQWLLTVLRSSKFSLEKTKAKLDLFHTVRTMLPEFFKNRDPFLPEIQHFLKKGPFIALSRTATPDGPFLMILRAELLDPQHLSIETVIKTCFMISDVLLNENDNCTVAGQAIIFDLKNMPYRYITQLSPMLLHNLVICFTNAYPSRPKCVHVINTPSFILPIYRLVQLWLSNKVAERIYFHFDNGGEAIHDFFPLTVLPKEYGGENESLSELAEQLKLKVESYQQWFLNDQKYGCDETKRPKNSQNSVHVWGTDGSFRMLSID